MGNSNVAPSSSFHVIKIWGNTNREQVKGLWNSSNQCRCRFVFPVYLTENNSDCGEIIVFQIKYFVFLASPILGMQYIISNLKLQFWFCYFFKHLFSANSDHFLFPSNPGLICILRRSFLFYIRPVSLRNTLKHMAVIPPHSSPPVEVSTVLLLLQNLIGPNAHWRHRGISATKPLTKKILKTLLYTYMGQIKVLYYLWRFRISREDRLISNSMLLHLRHLYVFCVLVWSYT